MSRRPITLDEMRSIIAQLERGDDSHDVALDHDRHHEAMLDAVNAFRLGVSRLAKQARNERTDHGRP